MSVAWLALGGAAASAFEVQESGASRTLQFKRPPNFEQPADNENNTYAGTVAIGDGSASVSVSVSVTDANDPGRIGLSTTTPQAGQTLTATLSDDDGVEESVCGLHRWRT